MSEVHQRRVETALVSVIIPTHNRDGLLGRTIESVWRQTYRPVELIVVDDGSTDRTSQDILHWQNTCADDEQFDIRYFRQDHKGAPAARNMGLAHSRGEFIQLFDSDDVMLPHKLEKKVSVLSQSQASFVACDCAIFRDSEDNWIDVWKFSRRPHTPASHVTNIALNTSAPMFRRKDLRRVGEWNNDLKRWQDLEFTFRVLAAGLGGIWLDEILFLVRDWQDNISHIRSVEVHDSYFRACLTIERTARRHKILDAQLRDAIGMKLASVYRMLAEEGQWALSQRYFRQAYRRMRLGNRARCSFHRLGTRVLGCELMKKAHLLYRV